MLYQRVIKRILDLTLGIVLGVIAIPILIIGSLIVFCLSPKSGSPIFFQERIGYKGKPFVMMKLRSMTNDKDDKGDFLPDEQRLKWWGKIIRKTNIDELTQIIHIICGKMSFIGPRPLLSKEMLVMTTDEQRTRQSVLPGIVGWESVNERKSSSRRQMAMFDLFYVEHCSFSLDIKIFFLTILSIFSFSRPDDSFRAPKLDANEIQYVKEKEKDV